MSDKAKFIAELANQIRESEKMDVDDLIQYLDTGLSLDTLREMDRTDLYKLRELLHHWEQMADRIYKERRATSIEEETE